VPVVVGFIWRRCRQFDHTRTVPIAGEWMQHGALTGLCLEGKNRHIRIKISRNVILFNTNPIYTALESNSSLRSLSCSFSSPGQKLKFSTLSTGHNLLPHFLNWQRSLIVDLISHFIASLLDMSA
jgi:hypothetical protein